MILINVVSPGLWEMLLEFLITPVIGGIIIWLIWLTKFVYANHSKIAVNSALDQKTQETLFEIKSEMKGFNEKMGKVMAKLNIS